MFKLSYEEIRRRLSALVVPVIKGDAAPYSATSEEGCIVMRAVGISGPVNARYRHNYANLLTEVGNAVDLTLEQRNAVMRVAEANDALANYKSDSPNAEAQTAEMVKALAASVLSL